MEFVPHKPDRGPLRGHEDYVRAMEVRGVGRPLFVSGTMGLNPAGTPGRTWRSSSS